jgi:glycine/D-amino acid oxidase-like deaminating enzyme
MTRKRITIKPLPQRRVAIVGAGFFGLSAALKIAEKGCLVTVYERERDALLGASYINQNRMHMGYHYPRSESTARSSYIYQKAFCKMYGEAVVGNFDHYYCIAKEGSKVDKYEFLAFCDRVGLPHEKEFPKAVTLPRDVIDLSIRVPERLYDANLLRNKMKQLLAREENIEVHYSTEVTGIEKTKKGYEVHSRTAGASHRRVCDIVINATYSGINTVLKMAGLRMEEYQYELCEVPIVKVPWLKRTGVGIMDGPFFGILPFGFSEEYMLYDVELSVLERVCGTLPEFGHDIPYYNQEERKKDRYRKYIEKASRFIPEMRDVAYLYSIYVTRVVLLNKDKDDARPTEILCHDDGFWSIFAGKICAAIPAADRIVTEIENYLSNL